MSGAAAADREAARRALGSWERLSDACVETIDQGLLHQTFLIESTIESPSGRFVLQCVNPVFSPGIHENIRAVTERLAARGIGTPRLLPTDAGALTAEIDGRRWRLLSHVEGRARDDCSSPALARAAAHLVARFHGALLDLDHDFEPLGFAFHDTRRHLDDLERALAAKRAHRHHAAVAELATSIRAAAAAWEPFSDLPDRVVHLDLKFNNILFQQEEAEPEPRAVAIIDLDTLSRMPFWVELGDAWRSWCNRRPEYEPTAELDAAIFEASAGAWLEALPLNLERAELSSLAHGLERLSLELCARFAADALEERYFGWRPELFETRGDHNLSRARGQLSLHDQARETRADRLRFLLG